MEETTMNANLMTKKIEMSKKEAKAAGKIGTPEFEELKSYMKEYPNFEILIKAPAKRKVEFRGLTYEYMVTYIKKHDTQSRLRRGKRYAVTPIQPACADWSATPESFRS